MDFESQGSDLPRDKNHLPNGKLTQQRKRQKHQKERLRGTKSNGRYLPLLPICSFCFVFFSGSINSRRQRAQAFSSSLGPNIPRPVIHMYLNFCKLILIILVPERSQLRLQQSSQIFARVSQAKGALCGTLTHSVPADELLRIPICGRPAIGLADPVNLRRSCFFPFGSTAFQPRRAVVGAPDQKIGDPWVPPARRLTKASSQGWSPLPPTLPTLPVVWEYGDYQP